MATTTGGGWDVFLSHDWGEGELGNNHERAEIVADELRKAGLKVWVDDDGKGGGQMAKGVTVGQAMADGIANSKVVVVCVTKNYSDKVGMAWAGTTDKKTDNCLREFNLAVQERGMLGMLSAVMEPSMARDRDMWSPRLKMEVGEMLHEDLAVKEEHELREAARKLADRVRNKIVDPKSSLESGAGARVDLFKIPFSSNVFMASKKARDFAPGTRQWILELVADWYAQPDGKWTRVFVLLGAAAVGKSTLAAYVAQRGGALMDDPTPLLCTDGPAARRKRGSMAMVGKRLTGVAKRMSLPSAKRMALPSAKRRSLARLASVEVRVGAVHMFNFGEADRSDLISAFMSISEQLCAAVPGLARELATVRQEIDPNKLRQGDLVEAFRVLVARPCMSVGAPPKRVVVVIDALDECSEESRRKLLRMLQDQGINETPDWLGFLVTSRPEDYIPHELKFKPTRVDAEKEKNEEDMRSYLRFRLGTLVANKAERKQVVAELTRRSEGAFLFARFLDEMLDGKTQLTLADLEDELAFPLSMKDVLRKYFERFHDKLGGPMYRALLMPMVVAREPLPEAIVRTILLEHIAGGANKKNSKRQEREVSSMIKKAQNLLYLGDDGGLRFVHKSMADWLTDEDNLAMEEDDDDLGVDETLVIDPVDAHAVMAERLADDREDRFALRHALWHLWHAGETDKANELLLDASWLLAALGKGVDPMDLVLDADAAHGSGRKAEVDDVLRVLELGAETLRKDPLQLASQLYGRLPADHAALRRVREAMPRPWLRPVAPALTPARSPLRKILRDHDEEVTSVAIQGGTIVSGSEDNTVRVWRAADGKCLHVLKGHGDVVTSVAIQGDTIVSGSDDKTVRVWRAADGECLHVLTGHESGVSSVAIEGDLIVSGSDDATVRVWRAADGKCLHVWTGHDGGVSSVAIHGDTIVSGSWDNTVRVWRAADGKCLHVWTEHGDRVNSVAIQGDLIVSGSDDATVRVWRAADGECLHTWKKHDDQVKSVAIQGDTIVSGSKDKTACVWRATDGEYLQVLKGHNTRVTSVAIQDDTIVSGSEDETVRVWRAAGGEGLPASKGHESGVSSVAIQGDTIVSGSLDNTVRVWRAADGQLVHVLTDHDDDVRGVAIHGDTIVSGSWDKTVRVWRAADGKCLHVLTGHDGGVSSVAIHGDTIVSGSWDNTVRVWRAADGKCLHVLEGHDRAVNSVAIQGDIVVSGSDDATVRVWRAADGECLHVLKGNDRPVTSVAIQGDTIESSDARVNTHCWSLAGLGLTASGHASSAGQGGEGVVTRAPLQFTVNGRIVKLQGHASDTTRAAAGVVPFTFDDCRVYRTTCSADVMVLGMYSGAVHTLTLEEAGDRLDEETTASSFDMKAKGGAEVAHDIAAGLWPVAGLFAGSRPGQGARRRRVASYVSSMVWHAVVAPWSHQRKSRTRRGSSLKDDQPADQPASRPSRRSLWRRA